MSAIEKLKSLDWDSGWERDALLEVIALAETAEALRIENETYRRSYVTRTSMEAMKVAAKTRLDLLARVCRELDVTFSGRGAVHHNAIPLSSGLVRDIGHECIGSDEEDEVSR